MAVRDEGLVLTGCRPDHRDLGECARHHARRRPGRPLGCIPHLPVQHLRAGARHARGRPTGLPVTFALVIGIAGSLHPGVIMAIGTLSARPENRAVGMGLFYSMYYAGGAVVPALCGHAADLYGSPEGALLAAAVVSALALPMFLLHRRMAAHELMLAKA